MKKYLLVTVSTFVLNAAAFAANVVPIEGPLVIPIDGSLLVNSGNGFQQLSGPAQVAAGGSVMVTPGGKGEIVYTDGCRVPVRSGALAQVDVVSPCAQGADFGVAPAAYGTPCCQDSSWLGYTALGVVGVAGIVAAAWGGNHHGNQNDPVIVVSNKNINPVTVTSTNTNTSSNTNSATGGNATASNANANTAVALALQAQNQDQAQQQQQQQQQCQGNSNNNNNTLTPNSHINTAICAVSP